jgi:hypothetical protein
MEKVILRYDGTALAEHSMNLEVLSDALGGLNALIKEVHNNLNSEDADLEVLVEGGFDEGSFEFILNVIENTDISTLAVIGFGLPVMAGGLIGAIKWLAGEKIDHIAFNEEGNCLVFKEDGESLEVASNLKEPLSSPKVRNSLKKLIQKPLNKDGIDTFEVLNPEHRAAYVEVSKGESSSFKGHVNPIVNSEDEPEIFDNAIITFVTVHKDKPTGWRVNYENEILKVKMADNQFIRQLAQESVFDDAYNVRLVAELKPNSIEKTYTIEEVYI